MNNFNLSSSVGLLSAALFLSSSGTAQEPVGEPASVFDAMDWRVPIHTAPADPTFGEYGAWAAGRGYKVSFHDGMCFYPVLGAEAPRNMPLRWETSSVRVGDAELLGADEIPSQHHDSWRFEYRFGGVSEIYEVRAEGVEQSFVIERPARIDGDLEVVGQWESPLTAVRDTIAGTSQAAIRFVDGELSDVIRYGGAIAFDAAGRQVDVGTELVGDTIKLVVPAAWVASATWPITVDPLLTSEALGALGPTASSIIDSDVAIAFSSATHRVMTTFSLPASGADSDSFAVISDDDFQNPVVVFADLQSGFETNHPRVAFVDDAGATGRWTIAIARTTSSASQIRVWLHDGGNTVFQSGSMMFLATTIPGWKDQKPDIGGSRNDEFAAIVFETDQNTTGLITDKTELHRVRVDADAGTFGPVSLLDPSPILPFSLQEDRANPSISQTSEGAPLGWVVCYQQRSFFPAEWVIRGRRLFSDGSASLTALIRDAVPGEPSNNIAPSVDGANTRYGVSYLLAGSNTSTSGSKMAMTRFLWAPLSAAPTVEWTSILDSAVLFGALYEPRVAADLVVGNWAVAYRKRQRLGQADTIRAVRVGFNGAVVESQTVYSSLSVDGAGPAIAYDALDRRLLLTYGTESARSPVFGRIWTYPTNAINVPYGASCGGDFGALSMPLVGIEFFRIRLTGAAPNTSAVLLIGGGTASIDLGIIGMPLCLLLVDPSVIISLPTATDPLGDALLTIVGLTQPIDLYMQWMHVSPGANQLGLLATGGMFSQVR